MQLSLYTDYGIRALVYLACFEEERRPIPAREIAEAFGIPKNHLHKIVLKLVKHGFMISLPGRSGGLKLAQRPHDIMIGDVVTLLEPGLSPVNCMDKATATCPITPFCALRDLMQEAMKQFVDTLNLKSLDQLLLNRSTLRAVLLQGGQLPAPRRGQRGHH
ncbi:MAG: Rrf2 family transcriptional regulator [Candidatus Cloacimonetes bacterium]|nr:Rrf2 family transcriptional regulator [Candidatus Cloacimonadota bacterium]